MPNGSQWYCDPGVRPLNPGLTARAGADTAFPALAVRPGSKHIQAADQRTGADESPPTAPGSRAPDSLPAAARTRPRRFSKYSAAAKCGSRCRTCRLCRSAAGFRAPTSISAAVASGAGVLRFAILHQFDRLHQAHAAHIADERILLLHLFQLRAQISAGFRGIDHAACFRR